MGTRKRMVAWLAVGISLLIPFAFLGNLHFSVTAQAEEQQHKHVTRLLNEKLAALEDILAIVTTMYDSGKGSFDDVYQATRALRNAELEQCSSPGKRVPVLEKMLSEARDLEKFVSEDLRRLEADRLKAKVNRLEVEIELERAKSAR